MGDQILTLLTHPVDLEEIMRPIIVLALFVALGHALPYGTGSGSGDYTGSGYFSGSGDYTGSGWGSGWFSGSGDYTGSGWFSGSGDHTGSGWGSGWGSGYF